MALRQRASLPLRVLTCFSDCARVEYSGGIRKMRWQAEGRGKRSGLRVIYYLATAQGEIFLLDLYAKNERADLSPNDLQDLRELVKEWLG